MQEYAQVMKLLGDSRLEVQCSDSKKRVGHIRGQMKKRVWIAQGDIVLVSLRENEEKVCDVIAKYTPEEARKLKKMGELGSLVAEPANGENKDD